MALEQFATAVLIEFLWHTDIDTYFNALDFFTFTFHKSTLFAFILVNF